MSAIPCLCIEVVKMMGNYGRRGAWFSLLLRLSNGKVQVGQGRANWNRSASLGGVLWRPATRLLHQSHTLSPPKLPPHTCCDVTHSGPANDSRFCHGRKALSLFRFICFICKCIDRSISLQYALEGKSVFLWRVSGPVMRRKQPRCNASLLFMHWWPRESLFGAIQGDVCDMCWWWGAANLAGVCGWQRWKLWPNDIKHKESSRS